MQYLNVLLSHADISISKSVSFLTPTPILWKGWQIFYGQAYTRFLFPFSSVSYHSKQETELGQSSVAQSQFSKFFRMTSVISRLIIKTLCEHKGCMDFQSLHESMRSFNGANSILQSFLSDDSKVAIKNGKLKATAGQKISPDSLVVAKTSLRICQRKTGECQQCDSLHLCRNYVCGNCTYG